ncbi:hypothetical protein [Microcoleus sp. N3A4]|uniref:hypothetical protein n=1 Tax=Microcoleus sp. N3A4 TaxID=3055379 RepID=UPI002FD76246
MPLFPAFRSLQSKKVKFAVLSALLFTRFAYHATVETGRIVGLSIALQNHFLFTNNCGQAASIQRCICASTLNSTCRDSAEFVTAKCQPASNLRKLDRPINFLHKSQKISSGLATVEPQAASDRSAY